MTSGESVVAEGREALVEPEEVAALSTRALQRISASPPPGPEYKRLEFLPVEDIGGHFGTNGTVAEMLASRSLLSVDHGGSVLLPKFQFSDGTCTSVAPIVSEILSLLGPVCADPRTLLAWFLAPKDELAGRRPADCVPEGQYEHALLLAARRDAARLE